MKKSTVLIIVLAVLALCALLFFVIPKNGSQDDGANTTPGVSGVPGVSGTSAAAGNYIATVDAETVDEISYSLPGEGQTFSFRLKADKTGWELTGDPDLPLSNTWFQSMVLAFTQLTAKAALPAGGESEGAESLSTYGLDAPALTVTFHDGKNGTQTFTVGSVYNSYGGGSRYLCYNKDPAHIYLIDAAVTTPFVSDPLAMLSPDTLSHGITLANVGYLMFTSADGQYSEKYLYSRSEDVWCDPDGAALDQKTGDELCQALANLAPGDIVGCRPADKAALGLDAPMTLTVFYANSQSIEDPQTGQTRTVTSDALLTLPVSFQNGTAYMSVEGSALSYRLSDPLLTALLEKFVGKLPK